MRRLLIALSLLALLAVGCSNDKKADTAKSDKTSSKSDDKKSDDKKSDDKKSDDKKSGGGGGGTFCGVYKGYDDDFADVDPTKLTDPRELVEQFEAIEEAVKKMVDVAPDEIRDDLELVMEAALTVFQALVEAEGDVTKIDPATFAGMQSPELEAATERLNTYVEEECGIDLSAN